MMMMKREGPKYVQDGLVLHLDGINKGHTTGWQSIVGNYYFENQGAVRGDNCFEFLGNTGSFMRSSNFSGVSASNGTIEVCYAAQNFSSMRVLFMPMTVTGTPYLAFGVLSTRRLIYRNISKGNVYVDTPLIGTTSATSSVCYANGSSKSIFPGDYLSGGSTTYSTIGKRDSTNPFYGKIYAIRIYNRQLTVDEILYNQRLDNKRFGLGLNI